MYNPRESEFHQVSAVQGHHHIIPHPLHIMHNKLADYIMSRYFWQCPVAYIMPCDWLMITSSIKARWTSSIVSSYTTKRHNNKSTSHKQLMKQQHHSDAMWAVTTAVGCCIARSHCSHVDNVLLCTQFSIYHDAIFYAIYLVDVYVFWGHMSVEVLFGDQRFVWVFSFGDNKLNDCLTSLAQGEIFQAYRISAFFCHST